MATIADVVACSLRRCAESRARDPALPRPRNALGRLGVAVAAALALCAGRGDPVAPDLLQHCTGFQGLTCSDKRAKRRSYNLAELQKLAVAASTFKEKCAAQGVYRWKNEFLYAHFGQLPVGPELQSMLSAAMKLEAFKTKRLAANTRGEKRSGGICATMIVPDRRRRRACYDRLVFCQELDDEVWHWFVDRLAANKTRVTTKEITAKAAMYAAAVEEEWRCRCDAGLADPLKPPRVPLINKDWVRRWRLRHNVSYRTINLRYKIPRATFLNRLGVFWSNCIILRALFEHFYPGKVLDFVGFDQKPLWFNSITAEKTLAPRGARKVKVSENVSASRMRFTVMTHVRSWCELVQPKIAVLFKIGDAASSLSTLRAQMYNSATTLLQGAPKGSYRLSQVLEFLQWVLEPAAASGRMTCVVLDWFAPHLDPSVDAMVHSLGHPVLRIGGGLTGHVQVGDTHAHRPYNNHYRAFEASDATAEMERAPHRLPACSKQTVCNRSEDAWALVRHDACAEGWKHNGITNALSGDEDSKLSSQVLSFWLEIGMPARRAQLLQDVKEAVEAGTVATFWDYPELLLQYDDHKPLPEGACFPHTSSTQLIIN